MEIAGVDDAEIHDKPLGTADIEQVYIAEKRFILL